MEPYELAAFITAAAVVVSKNIPDNDELGVLATSFTQLGDTLATIIAQRELIANKAAAGRERPEDRDEILIL